MESNEVVRCKGKRSNSREAALPSLTVEQREVTFAMFIDFFMKTK